MNANLTISKDIGADGKNAEITFGRKPLFTYTNIKITGHTRGGLMPAPTKQRGPNDHTWRSHLDPHLRPTDSRGRFLYRTTQRDILN